MVLHRQSVKYHACMHGDYLFSTAQSVKYHARLFYGCSYIGFTCPAITVGTVILRACMHGGTSFLQLCPLVSRTRYAGWHGDLCQMLIMTAKKVDRRSPGIRHLVPLRVLAVVDLSRQQWNALQQADLECLVLVTEMVRRAGRGSEGGHRYTG